MNKISGIESNTKKLEELKSFLKKCKDTKEVKYIARILDTVNFSHINELKGLRIGVGPKTVENIVVSLRKENKITEQQFRDIEA